MVERGHEACVLALLEPGGRWEALATLSASGVEVVEIRVPPKSYRVEVKRLTAELARRSGAIAHSHGYHADLVSLRAARAALPEILQHRQDWLVARDPYTSVYSIRSRATNHVLRVLHAASDR